MDYNACYVLFFIRKKCPSDHVTDWMYPGQISQISGLIPTKSSRRLSLLFCINTGKSRHNKLLKKEIVLKCNIIH